MQKLEKKFIFLVFLGGKSKKSNIELHDVRWVVGSKIEDTYDVLRKDWFGCIEGLHIDSYKKIKSVDGYYVKLKKIVGNKRQNNHEVDNRGSKKTLWFVNLGGYDPNSMQEKHEFGLVVADSKLEAKKKAKSKWLIGLEKKHKDDITSLRMLIRCDDCEAIKKLGEWEIELTPSNNLVEETNSPDWYGYRRIDLL